MLLQHHQRPMSKATRGVHYSISKFQLSLGHSTAFTYSLTNNKEETYNIQNPTSPVPKHVSKIICELHRVHELNMNHIPHFSQAAFPCWSILHSYQDAGKYVLLKDIDRAQLTSTWIADLMQVFESQNITFLQEHNHNDMIQDDESVWMAQLTEGPFGGFPKEVQVTKYGPKYKIENTKYFLTQKHVHLLQEAILDQEFRSIVPVPDQMEPIRVLLIDRKNHTREWTFANETKHLVESIYDASELTVEIISNPDGSLKEQARMMHHADVIVSPHGAQLTNLAFVRPCTAVLELFPRAYYLGYFQPLVLSAGALSWDGYPWDRSPLVDTQYVLSSVERRVMVRSWNIATSPESVVRGLPEMISSLVMCRSHNHVSDEE